MHTELKTRDIVLHQGDFWKILEIDEPYPRDCLIKRLDRKTVKWVNRHSLIKLSSKTYK